MVPAQAATLVDRVAPWLLAVAALAFVATGLWAVATLSWTELYADQWRVHAVHLEQSFPWSVLIHDNGHRQVLPALVRVAEIRLGIGGMALQYLLGTATALLAWALLARTALVDSSLALSTRWLVVALAAFALFWLGLARILLSAYESPTDYFLVACVVGALLLATRPQPTAADTAGAALLALLGTFCYGSGVAGFGAVAMLLAVQRRWRGVGWIVAAAVGTALLYVLLPASGGGGNALRIDPVNNILDAAAWLGSLATHLFGWLIDPDASRSFPGALRAAVLPLATAWREAVGSLEHTRWFALLSLPAVVGLAVATWRAWRRGDAGRMHRVGLGLAWFAVGMALIVALARTAYFQEHPGQRYANRYLLWSSLFWLGIMVAWLSRSPVRPAACAVTAPSRPPVPAVAVALAMLAAGWATSSNFRIWGEIVQANIRRDVAGIVSGVVPAGVDLGETVFAEVERNRSVYRRHHYNAFGWPEARVLGLAVAAGAGASGPNATLMATPVANRLQPGAALRLEVAVAGPAPGPWPPRLLALHDGVATGVLVAQRSGASAPSYVGFVALPEGAVIRIGELDDDGRLRCWVGCDRR